MYMHIYIYTHTHYKSTSFQRTFGIKNKNSTTSNVCQKVHLLKSPQNKSC